MATTDEFPAVEGGGSLILAWQVRGKKVLVIGGGEVSTLEWTSDSGDHHMHDGLANFKHC
jgi:hypothetical protein